MTFSEIDSEIDFFVIYLFISSFGGRTRARTWDPLIKSQLLYQLSYAPGLPSAGPRQARFA